MRQGSITTSTPFHSLFLQFPVFHLFIPLHHNCSRSPLHPSLTPPSLVFLFPSPLFCLILPSPCPYSLIPLPFLFTPISILLPLYACLYFIAINTLYFPLPSPLSALSISQFPLKRISFNSLLSSFRLISSISPLNPLSLTCTYSSLAYASTCLPSISLSRQN